VDADSHQTETGEERFAFFDSGAQLGLSFRRQYITIVLPGKTVFATGKGGFVEMRGIFAV
jgi:hypothetical protein